MYITLTIGVSLIWAPAGFPSRLVYDCHKSLQIKVVLDNPYEKFRDIKVHSAASSSLLGCDSNPRLFGNIHIHWIYNYLPFKREL